MKIDDVNVPAEVGGTSYKAMHLISVRDGSDEYVAINKVTIFAHDYAKALRADTDIPYRISGKSMIVKTPDGHEVKGHLCETVGQGTKCGSDAFF